MRKIISYLTACFCSVFLTGCSVVVSKLSGIHDPAHLSNPEIENIAWDINIPPGNSFVLDTLFENFYRRMASDNGQISHDHLQPLQVNVYDHTGRLISFHINCSANGLISLDWNTDKRFDVLPPVTAVRADSSLSSTLHLSMIYDYKAGHYLSAFPEKYDYLFIVHWCVFWKKQSRRLVKFMEEYRRAHPQDALKILYVNDDNLYGG